MITIRLVIPLLICASSVVLAILLICYESFSFKGQSNTRFSPDNYRLIAEWNMHLVVQRIKNIQNCQIVFHILKSKFTCFDFPNKTALYTGIVITSSNHTDSSGLFVPCMLRSSMSSPDHTASSSTYCHEKIETDPAEASSKVALKAAVLTSKRAIKRKKKAEQPNVPVKRNRNSETSGFTADLFNDTDYFFENGLRKVYPYYFSFTTYAKGRWLGRSLLDVYTAEFRGDAEDHQISLEVGNISVNGKVGQSDYIIRNNDFISHSVHRHENPVCDRPIELLHVDDDMIVIDKPSSIPCHPCGKYRFNSILFILGKQLGLDQLRNIYRLDRLTSGVLIMGRTDCRTKQLEAEVANRLVEKEYICRVIGDFPSGTTTVDQPLGCICHKLSLYRVDPQGKPSCTVFDKVHYNGHSTIVKCRPVTGRTHQIRVHLQYLGHPIVNDPLYNTDAWGPSRCKGGVLDKTLQELQEAIRAEHHVGKYVDVDDDTNLTLTPLTSTARVTTQTHTCCRHTCNDDTTADLVSRTSTPSSDCVNNELRVGIANKQSHSNESNDDIQQSHSTEPNNIQQSHSNEPNNIQQSHSTEPNNIQQSHSTEPNNIQQLHSNESNDNIQQSYSTEPNDDIHSESSHCLGTIFTKSTDVMKYMDTQPGYASHTVKSESGNMTFYRKIDDTGKSHDTRDMINAHIDGGGERSVVGGWVRDKDCYMCRRRYINPRPQDLVMYLHALRYKGPAWEFSTDVPEWGKLDWCFD